VAGMETTLLPGNLQLPIIFDTSPVAVSAEASQIQALEICQVFMKIYVMEGMEHLENSDEETNKMGKRVENGK
jgi:hypothetical protein